MCRLGTNTRPEAATTYGAALGPLARRPAGWLRQDDDHRDALFAFAFIRSRQQARWLGGEIDVLGAVRE